MNDNSDISNGEGEHQSTAVSALGVRGEMPLCVANGSVSPFGLDFQLVDAPAGSVLEESLDHIEAPGGPATEDPLEAVSPDYSGFPEESPPINPLRAYLKDDAVVASNHVRRHSSALDGAEVPGELAMSDEVSAILDWDVALADDEEPESSETTPSVGAVNAWIKGQEQRQMELLRSLDNLVLRLEDSSVPCEPEGRSSPSVYHRTPVISKDVLTRMRTRSCGAVPALPNVMDCPLEYQLRK